MTEEIKIGKKDVVACNYWKACDYYKQLKRLEQENKELKKQLLEDKILDEHIESLNQEDTYRSALEEIKEALGEKYGMADIIKIRNILNEVLNVKY